MKKWNRREKNQREITVKNAVNIKNSAEGLGGGMGNPESPDEARARERTFHTGVWRV